MILLILLPVGVLANVVNPEESVVFKLFVNGHAWGQVTVLCDAKECYVNLPEMLTQLEYAYQMQPSDRHFMGYVSAAGEQYEIDGDTLTMADAQKTVSDVIWDDNGELYIKAGYIYKLYGIQLNFTMSALSVNLTTTSPIPAQLRQ